MDTKGLDISIEDFKKVIEEECTEENCWKPVYEGVLRKDYPGNPTLFLKLCL